MSIDKNLLKKFTLLYVEDDDVIRVELSQLLSNFFSMVHVAKNGKEGLLTFLENQDEIDLILTDLNMPELNGIEMVKKIRDFDTKIPVILATAYSDNEFLLDAIKLRDLLLQVLYIKTKEQSDNFKKGFKLWEDRFGLELSRSTNRGKVFSDLLRTRSMITNALPNMFSYIENPEISKTTNALEGYFGRLKQKYRVHRGLSPQKRKSYFNWYFYLKPI